jgi:hypothetical protein
MRQSAVLTNPQQAHAIWSSWWASFIKPALAAGQRLVVEVKPETRSTEQNAAQWPILEAFAKQKQLCVSGRMEWVSGDEWKDVLTASFRDELARVANFRGRMILLGQRTSKFRKDEFSEWLEWLHAAAIEEGVTVYPEDERAAA